MQNFLQYNYVQLISIVSAIVFCFIGLYITNKYVPSENVPFTKKLILWLTVIGILFDVGAIIHKTFYNQMPKTELNTSAVERSMSKYQESVIRNTNKEK